MLHERVSGTVCLKFGKAKEVADRAYLLECVDISSRLGIAVEMEMGGGLKVLVRPGDDADDLLHLYLAFQDSYRAMRKSDCSPEPCES